MDIRQGTSEGAWPHGMGALREREKTECGMGVRARRSAESFNDMRVVVVQLPAINVSLVRSVQRDNKTGWDYVQQSRRQH